MLLEVNIKKLFLAFLFVFINSDLYSQNSGDSIFSGIKVHTINLRFSQPAYWDSLMKYYNDGDEQYLPAKAIVNNNIYDTVGVRFKGNSSFNHPNNKKSFRISFDEFVDNQKWDGLKSVHLNNCWGDPTFMREKIHLDFCRDINVSSPRANYVKLLINDTLWGFYSLVEHVDKTFLKSHYDNNKGDLFKAVDAITDTGAGSQIYSDFLWYGNIDSLYYPHYELKTDGSATGWQRLVSFLDTLNNISNPELTFPLKINLLNLYKSFAVDNLFANLDSYINSCRNFYFYFNPLTGKMEWIVWDAGLSFGAYQGGISSVETINVLYLKNSSLRPLFNKIISSSVLKNEYLQNLTLVFKNYFTSAKLFPHIDSIANIIRPYVNEDPRKMYTFQQFEMNITNDITAIGGNGTRKPGLKSFINLRQVNVQTQLVNLGYLDLKTDLSNSISEFSLSQNFPNPFSAQSGTFGKLATTISYKIPKTCKVTLKIFDILGNEVATLLNEEKDAGTHTFEFNGTKFPFGVSYSSGVYFYKLQADQYFLTKQMVFLK